MTILISMRRLSTRIPCVLNNSLYCIVCPAGLRGKGWRFYASCNGNAKLDAEVHLRVCRASIVRPLPNLDEEICVRPYRDAEDVLNVDRQLKPIKRP
jgi:hypothetical protein